MIFISRRLLPVDYCLPGLWETGEVTSENDVTFEIKNN